MTASATEALLTGPFAVPTATPAQRAACRIIDGVPLGELAEHPDTADLIGADPSALPQGMPREVVFLASVRSAKTVIACAAAYRATQTVNLDGLGPGEVPRVSLVSLTLDLSQVAFGILRGTIMATPALKRTVIGEPTADSLLVRHPSGRPVEIKCVAAAKAGGGLVARWSAGVIFDEAPRMNSAGDGAVINLQDARSAILGRMRPGAQVLYIGSAWAPAGHVYDTVQERFGKPGQDLIVLRGTGQALNPYWWTPERCAALQASDPVAYRTDVLGEFADPESGLLSPIVVHASKRQTPLDLPRSADPKVLYAAALDPSEGGSKGNGFSLALVEVTGRGDDARFRVACVREWRGIRPDEAMRQVAMTLRPYGVSQVTSDQYAASALADLARKYGLTLLKRTTTAQNKFDLYANLATLIHTDRIELPPDKQLIDDLIAIRKRTSTSGGYTIHLPKTGSGRHCDLAAALALAVKSTAYRSWHPSDGRMVITGPLSDSDWGGGSAWRDTRPRKSRVDLEIERERRAAADAREREIQRRIQLESEQHYRDAVESYERRKAAGIEPLGTVPSLLLSASIVEDRIRDELKNK